MVGRRKRGGGRNNSACRSPKESSGYFKGKGSKAAGLLCRNYVKAMLAISSFVIGCYVVSDGWQTQRVTVAETKTSWPGDHNDISTEDMNVLTVAITSRKWNDVSSIAQRLEETTQSTVGMPIYLKDKLTKAVDLGSWGYVGYLAKRLENYERKHEDEDEADTPKDTKIKLDPMDDKPPIGTHINLGEQSIAKKSFLYKKDAVRVGFASEKNKFPFLKPGEEEELAKMVMEGSANRHYTIVNLNKDGLQVKDSAEDGRTSSDLVFGLGWFFAKSLKSLRRVRAEAANKREKNEAILFNHTFDQWREGLFWPHDVPHVSRNFSSHKSDDYVPFLVAYAGEAYDGGDCSSYDVVVECGGAYDSRKVKFHGCPRVFGLSALRNMMEGDFGAENLVQSLGFTPPDPNLRQFAGFLVKNCYHSKYTPDAAVRPAFFDLLSEYKPVMALRNEAGGGCRVSNSSIDVVKKGKLLHAWDAAIKTFSKFKFVISFENRRLNGYLTEKIINALLGGAIPIYFGAPDIGNFLNPKRFIHCDVDTTEVLKYSFPGGKEKAGKNPEPIIQFVKDKVGDKLIKCVERVKEIDQDDELFRSIVSEPILINNRLEGSEFDVHTIIQRVRRVLHMHQTGRDPLDGW